MTQICTTAKNVPHFLLSSNQDQSKSPFSAGFSGSGGQGVTGPGKDS